MDRSNWNMEIVNSFLLTMLHIVIFVVLIFLIIYFIKRVKNIGIKIVLAVLPVVILFVYFNYTVYFFTNGFLKSYARDQIERFYESFDHPDILIPEDGSEEPPVKNEGRNIVVEFYDETILRKGKQYQYNARIKTQEYTEAGLISEEFYINRIYEWDKRKFNLIGIGSFEEKLPGMKLR